MDEEKTGEESKTGDELRQREAKDSTTSMDTGSAGAYGPPEVGERGDPQRDPESGVPRDPVKPEPGDIDPADEPGMGKDTHGG